MMNGNLYNYINVYTKAADASWARMKVINNNLANISTPKFKRSDVEFEQFLSEQLQGSGNMDERISNVDLDQLNYEVYDDNTELSYRKDGNNVDIDVETSYQAETQVKYKALMDSITNEFSRIRTVLNK